MFVRELFEAPNKTASFALGRLNPATTGHELLVNAIKSAPGDSFLFLTDRAPKLPKDPLSSEEKLEWARKSFNGISIALAKTVLIAADRLYKMGYTDVVYLEGDDPEKPFLLSELIKKYNGVKKDLHDYKFKSIQVIKLPRDASAEDATGMSGTKIREYVKNNDLEGFKTGVTAPAQPHAEEMFKKLKGLMGVDAVEEKVDPEIATPKTIKVMKPTNPPKAPDATIPRTRSGHTKKDGTTYIQDKYDDKLMHVRDGGGTYTFDDSRMIKWQTPRIKGLKFIYDYVQRKIYLDAKNEVDIKDGPVNVDQLAAYDMKGNLIQGSGSLGIGAGGMRVSMDKDKLSIKYNMGAGLTVHATGSRNKKPSPEAQKLLKTALGKVQAGENINFTDALSKLDKAGATVQFRYMGKGIPFRQGVEMLKKASK